MKTLKIVFLSFLVLFSSNQSKAADRRAVGAAAVAVGAVIAWWLLQDDSSGVEPRIPLLRRMVPVRTIKFYDVKTPERAKHFGFTDFERVPVEIDGEWWNSIDVWLEAQKFKHGDNYGAMRSATTDAERELVVEDREEAYEKIKKSSGIEEARKIARKYSRYVDHKLWYKGDRPLRVNMMKKALIAKFKEHEYFGGKNYLRRLLLETGDARLVYDTEANTLRKRTTDDVAREYFWGNGIDGNGQNWLGRLLMEVRAEVA